MKLLIADDEKLTREGIRNRLDLDRLGITEVLLADDGIHGLETAQLHHPDIVLTDVRMPRMNGVDMAEHILSFSPDTVIIFMSAYSDKEYLKAAIKLKAVGYVEKPLDMTELFEALKTAVGDSRSKKARQTAVKLHERDLIYRLASFLTEPEPLKDPSFSELMHEADIFLDDSICFSTLILDCVHPYSSQIKPSLLQISIKYRTFLEEISLPALSFIREDRFIINFFYSKSRIEEDTLFQCADFLKKHLHNVLDHFFISLGPIVWGTENTCHSYSQAMKCLKGSFFHEYGTILLPETAPYRPPADVLLDFITALTGQNEERAFQAVTALYESIHPSDLLTPSMIRDLYYRYLGKLEEISLNSYLSLWQREGMDSESIWEGVMSCDTLKELHLLLCTKTALYFDMCRNNSAENPVVFQVKDYIHQNYGNPALSVPDISSHVHLSSSYVCTLFKNETGQTLNQYLTDYRIKMSKQFLSDPRYKITDISVRVGYSDSNYYGKTFRKIVGLSPSEYREKMLS